MGTFVHESVAEIPEAPFIRKLIAGVLTRDYLFNFVGIDKDSLPLPSVSLSGLPGERRGDIDILLVAPGRPQAATAIQVKRIKVGAAALRSGGQPNGLRRLEKGKRQANMLAEIGFQQVYLYVFVVVDSRQKNAGRHSCEGVMQPLRSVIQQAITPLGLNERARRRNPEPAKREKDLY